MPSHTAKRHKKQDFHRERTAELSTALPQNFTLAVLAIVVAFIGEAEDHATEAVASPESNHWEEVNAALLACLPENAFPVAVISIVVDFMQLIVAELIELPHRMCLRLSLRGKKETNLATNWFYRPFAFRQHCPPFVYGDAVRRWMFAVLHGLLYKWEYGRSNVVSIHLRNEIRGFFYDAVNRVLYIADDKSAVAVDVNRDDAKFYPYSAVAKNKASHSLIMVFPGNGFLILLRDAEYQVTHVMVARDGQMVPVEGSEQLAESLKFASLGGTQRDWKWPLGGLFAQWDSRTGHLLFVDIERMRTTADRHLLRFKWVELFYSTGNPLLYHDVVDYANVYTEGGPPSCCVALPCTARRVLSSTLLVFSKSLVIMELREWPRRVVFETKISHLHSSGRISRVRVRADDTIEFVYETAAFRGEDGLEKQGQYTHFIAEIKYGTHLNQQSELLVLQRFPQQPPAGIIDTAELNLL